MAVHHLKLIQHCKPTIGEGNGNPLQCSCLENPRDGRAWWAAIQGVAQSQTRLKRLSSKPTISWYKVKVKLKNKLRQSTQGFWSCFFYFFSSLISATLPQIIFIAALQSSELLQRLSFYVLILSSPTCPANFYSSCSIHVKISYSRKSSVLVSRDCSNKYHRFSGLKSHIYSLYSSGGLTSEMSITKLRSGVSKAASPQRFWRRICSLSLSASSGCQHPSACEHMASTFKVSIFNAPSLSHLPIAFSSVYLCVKSPPWTLSYKDTCDYI